MHGKYILIRQWKGRKKEPQVITRRWEVEELLKIVNEIYDEAHEYIIIYGRTEEEVWRSE